MPLYISFQEHLLATQTRSCLINVHPRSYRKKSVKYDISLQIDNNADALKCNQGICHSSYKNQSLRFRMTVELMNNILLEYHQNSLDGYRNGYNRKKIKLSIENTSRLVFSFINSKAH